MDRVTLPEAAEQLGVTPSQVQRLIATGELRAERFGRVWAVDVASIRERSALRPQRGRPLSEAGAWNQLAQQPPLSGLEKLSAVAVAVRRRARLHRCRALPAELDTVADDERVVLGGAVGAAAQGAATAGLGLDVYVSESVWPAFAVDHNLSTGSAEPNIYVRVVQDENWPFGDDGFAPLVVCAVDSYERLDRRSAHEALAAAPR